MIGSSWVQSPAGSVGERMESVQGALLVWRERHLVSYLSSLPPQTLMYPQPIPRIALRLPVRLASTSHPPRTKTRSPLRTLHRPDGDDGPRRREWTRARFGRRGRLCDRQQFAIPYAYSSDALDTNLPHRCAPRSSQVQRTTADDPPGYPDATRLPRASHHPK